MFVLFSPLLFAQAYIPGFSISGEGEVLVEIPTGHYSDLLHDEGFSSSDLLLEAIPADTSTLGRNYWDARSLNKWELVNRFIDPPKTTHSYSLLNQ
ncbi:MAG: hypothetical protein ACK5B6_01985 [Bacteroidia bacterium]